MGTTTTPAYRVTNPATGEIVEEFAFATDAEIADALAASQAAYEDWSSRTIEERAAVITRAAELFEERKDELARLAAIEMGKPAHEAVGEAELSGAIVGYYAEHGPEFTKDQEVPTLSDGTAYIQRLPVGPLLGIMPWNFPMYQVARFAGPNLVLGNTIILKHAESCPKSALAIEQLFLDAGVPKGGYINVFATHEQIADIIADPRIQGVSLTGSERAGSIIGAQAGKHLKKAVLELGGSDPYVILDSNDVHAAAELAWGTRIYNGGQVCNGNKRMIVMDDIFDDFVGKLTELAKSVSPADPLVADETNYGPMSSRRAAEDLNAQVQDAVSKGATLHAGGVLSEGPDAYFSPAVLSGVTPEMRAYQEELFGPVAVVYKVTSDEEALELANNTPFGLGGAVFSQDEERAAAIARKLQVGMANVNTPAGEGPELPFGGVKRSGFGRELGPLGMDEFVNKRLYFVANQ